MLSESRIVLTSLDDKKFESSFRKKVERFKLGVPRAQLKPGALKKIACLRFPSIAVTVIEAPHAKLNRVSKRHAVQGIRVSLSNRLLMLERWLSLGEFSIDELVRSFEKCRRIKDFIMVLGLAEHPSLIGHKTLHPMQIRKLLSRILYRCDIDHKA